MAADASFSESEALSTTSLDRAPAASLPATGYALGGMCAFAIAPLAGTLAALQLWFGVAQLVLAYAYASNRPTVFGKRGDGTLAPLSVALLFPYLALVWAFHGLKLAGLRREPCWHAIAPGIYLGRRPRAG